MDEQSNKADISPTSGEVLESMAKTMWATFKAEGQSEWACRMSVAMSFGYYDAKYMRYAKETMGLALVDQLMIFRQKWPGLKVPYAGLRSELTWMGKKPSAVDSELRELQEFDNLYQEEKNAKSETRPFVPPQPDSSQPDAAQPQEVCAESTSRP